MHVTRPDLVPLVNMVVSFTPIHLVFGSLRDDADKQFLFEQILDPESRIDNRLLDAVADQLVLEWFWMPRWTVQEIWYRVLGAWAEVDGELQMRGVDLITLPPARATNAVKALLTKWVSADADARAELHNDFTTEPLRILRKHQAEETTPEAVEAAAYDFTAALELMKQHQR
ncbi:hypothetical protein [Rhodococcus sp. IEGM 1379]|uniref:hypothetical protein n=1 Tax=Rhodococcus sp. IEGM 1379 TaxID=3047086 RepID=UPI0024B7A354|nr:hypothetical protein [Rhodococcus sp. IEGM 1379]MDI9914345.1 hypothetical protein [Rhodococcus sp. IEGM 1379]